MTTTDPTFTARRDQLLAASDVDAVRDLLDLMSNFPSNDQRARYLLSSNWYAEARA